MRAVRRFPCAEKRVAAAMDFIERYGDLFVLTFRFAYGVRNVASVACGMAGISRLRFAVLNFIAAGLWASSFVAVVWYLASWLGADGLRWAIGLGGLGLVVAMVWRYRRSRRPGIVQPVP